MKTSTAIATMLALALFCNGQSFIQENKTWNVVQYISFGPCLTQTFKLTGDTTILEVDYKKLYATYDTAMMNYEIFGAMRETDNKVFLYHFQSEKEEIMYDFSLLPGDSFTTTNYAIYGCPVELLLTSIDTVMLANGEQRQRFNFGYGGYNEEQWIAEIGSLNGPVNVGVYLCAIDQYFILSCCHVEYKLIYQSPHYETCIVTVGVTEKEHQINHAVYPNPFIHHLVLEFDYTSSQNYCLQIINSKGQIVKDISEINPGKILIDGNQLNQGIYFYKLSDNGIVIASGKIVKK